MDKSQIEDIYPLTPMQEGLLFQTLFDSESAAYFLQIRLNWQGNLQVERFRDSWRQLMQRHVVLRSVFVHEGVKRPVQITLKRREPEIELIDLREADTAEQAAKIEAYQIADKARGFDLQKDVLIRIAIFQIADQQYQLVWSYHHILFDGWSFGILQHEFVSIYRALQKGLRPRLRPVATYKQFIRWLEGRSRDRAKNHWRTYLAGYEQVASIPKLLPETDDFTFGQNNFIVDAALTEKLQQVASQNKATLNSLVRAVWSLVLGRHSGLDEVVFGTIVSGRPAALRGVEEMVGLFINAVPVRAKLGREQTFADLLRQIQRAALNNERYHYLPLAEIQAASPLGRNLFDHMLIFENYPMGAESEGNDDPDDFAIDGVGVHDRTHYDLDITVTPGEGLFFQINHNAAVYTPDQIERLVSHLQTLLEAIVADPTQKLADLPLMTTAEEEQLLVEFAGPTRDYPLEQTIHALFEAQVAKTPDKEAVWHNGRGLTYQALNEYANRIARYLRDTGLQNDDFVAILDHRGVDFLAAILGIQKAGGAYIPIDPSYPAERVTYMLDNSQAARVITRTEVWREVKGSQGAVQHTLLLDKTAALVDYATSNLEHTTNGRNRAYMIYTSGSTGNPKGAIIRHDGAINHIYGEFELLNFHADSTFLQSAPSSSDISVWQFLGPVLIGGRSVIADLETVADAQALFHLIKDEKMTIIELVPIVLKALLDYAADLPAEQATLPSLEWAMVTGEAVPPALVNQWLAQYPDIHLINAYGPTEAADDVTQHVIAEPIPLDGRSVPVGKPLPNLQIYVVDEQLNPVPIGVTGEICVGGIGVGEGYWRKPEKTAAAFVEIGLGSRLYGSVARSGDRPQGSNGDSSLPTCHSSFIYRTGDLGRWLPDGTLEYLDRIDQQIQLRGFRIETGEIETQLMSVCEIETAVVLLKQESLVAYLVGEKLDISSLRGELRQKLPDHMVPSRFIWLDALPQTPNGKIDRKGLKERSDADTGTADHVAPRNETEANLAQIWGEILGNDKLSIHDNFFALGGHSLLAMQIVSRILKTFERAISLRDFFEAATIAEQAGLIAQREVTKYDAIQPATQQPYYPLSHAQKRLWLEHQFDQAAAYNMPEAYLLTEPLDVPALERTFQTIIARHEALRTAFVLVDGEPRQRILADTDFKIRQIDLSKDIDQEAKARELVNADANEAFDLTHPPLLRATFIKMTESRHIFVLTIHHIIGDGWSGTVLYKEITALYDAYRNGRDNPLKPLRIQYKDFTMWQLDQGFAKEETYWVEQLSGVPKMIALPTDFTDSGDRDFKGSRVMGEIDTAVTSQLNQIAQRHQTTLSTVILALFKLVLYQVSKQSDLCIGIAHASRNHPDLENLLGFFVNMLPIRTQISGEIDFDQLLAQVASTVNDAFEHQDYPFDLMVEKLNPERVASRPPIINVAYGFQSYGDVTVEGQAENEPQTDEAEDNIAGFEFSFETTKFYLTLTVLAEDTISLALEYDTGLYKRRTAERYLGALIRFAGMVGASETEK